MTPPAEQRAHSSPRAPPPHRHDERGPKAPLDGTAPSSTPRPARSSPSRALQLDLRRRPCRCGAGHRRSLAHRRRRFGRDRLEGRLCASAPCASSSSFQHLADASAHAPSSHRSSTSSRSRACSTCTSSRSTQSRQCRPAAAPLAVPWTAKMDGCVCSSPVFLQPAHADAVTLSLAGSRAGLRGSRTTRTATCR